MSRLVLVAMFLALFGVGTLQPTPVTAAPATSHVVTFGAYAPATCAYTVRAGDWLSKIAAHYDTTWQRLAALNHLRNPNLIHPGEVLSVCGGAGSGGGGQAPHAIYHDARYPNYGAPGQCVWYAQAQRPDLNLAGIGGAKDLVWLASQRGYHVGFAPAVGALAVFAPGVDGANLTYGHVAVIRAVYADGSFLVAAMAAPYHWVVSFTRVRMRSGITIIYG